MAEPFATLRLEHSSTVDRVAGALRRALFDGEVEAGTALREQALAASLGVGRSTVREALGVLVAEGLATREPHRGVTVASPDAATVTDVCRARLVLEGAGVRRWPEATGAQRDGVRLALGRYLAALRDGASYEELNDRHLAFHVSLVGLTGSPRLVASAEQLVRELRLALAQVDRVRRNAHAQDPGAGHAALVRLLERGEVEAAHALLERHLAEARQAVLEALGIDAGSTPTPGDLP